MREPELWTRCPKAVEQAWFPLDFTTGLPTRLYDWGCECHGIGNYPTLVRVPFDEAHWLRWCPHGLGSVILPGTCCLHGSVPCLVLVNPDRAAFGEGT